MTTPTHGKNRQCASVVSFLQLLHTAPIVKQETLTLRGPRHNQRGQIVPWLVCLERLARTAAQGGCCCSSAAKGDFGEFGDGEP